MLRVYRAYRAFKVYGIFRVFIGCIDLGRVPLGSYTELLGFTRVGGVKWFKKSEVGLVQGLGASGGGEAGGLGSLGGFRA